MATKFKPNKKGVVKGTKKKDKIVWDKSWKKAITVNAIGGNDTIDFKKSKYKNNKLNGGDGNDTIYGGSNVDIIKGDKGNDKLYGNGGNDQIWGGAGNDLIEGGKSNDKLFGDAGNDTIKAGAGNDTIDGGIGSDVIYGNSGTNILKGGIGNDKIYGGSGVDKIYGGAGNDIINGGKGANTIYLNKNEGVDTIQNGGGNDTVVFAQEKNFDNFKFIKNGNDLNVSASGTTAIIKGYANGTSSVKNVVAGSSSFSKLYTGAQNYEIHGTNGNDLFIMNDYDEHKIYTGGGNDILFLEDEYYEIYASKGNNYFYLNDSDAEIYLKDMSGNNTIVTDFEDYLTLDFSQDETSYSEAYQVLGSILTPDEDTLNYILGQKSNNDLIIKALNGKTVTIKNYYNRPDMDTYISIEDCECSVSLDNDIIFFETPTVTKLTGNDTINNSKHAYIYGYDNKAYTLNMSNIIDDSINIGNVGNKTVQINNAQLSSISVFGNYDQSALATLTVSGAENEIYSYMTSSGSTFTITGNNNRINLSNIASSTVNVNGNDNRGTITAGNNGFQGVAATITVNTSGKNDLCLYADDVSTNGKNVTYTVNSTGNDDFYVGFSYNYFTHNFDFTGSAGTNKKIDTGRYNNINITGANDAGEIKLVSDSAKGYVIAHNYSQTSFTLSDFDYDTMSFRTSNSSGSTIKFTGTEANATDLNTTAFANKVKIDIGDGSYKTLNNFAQIFSVGSSFEFGGETMGYMSNLTQDYIVQNQYSQNTTYSNYTFATGRHTIVDVGGNDSLAINENMADLRMFFNVANDGSVYNSDLYFVKTSEFKNFMNGNTVSGYLDIKKGIGGGEIETVTANDGDYSLNYSNLTASATADTLVSEVASWLSDKGYADSMAVINGNNAADKTALFNIYNTYTDFANNAQNLYWNAAV